MHVASKAIAALVFAIGIAVIGIDRAQAQDVGLSTDGTLADSTDQYAPGKVAMGGDLAGRPGITEALAACGQQQAVSNARYLCTFADDDGVTYMFSHDPEDHGAYIVNIARVSESSPYHGRLLAGISLGDSLAMVRRKLRTLPTAFSPWTYFQRDGMGPVLKSAYNIRSSTGALWGLRLVFDTAEHLTAVSTEFDFDTD